MSHLFRNPIVLVAAAVLFGAIAFAIPWPTEAAEFITYASARTFSECNQSLVSGGTFDGSGLASAVAPSATTLGTCGTYLTGTPGGTVFQVLDVDAMADASAFLATGQLHVSAVADGPGDAFAVANMADKLTISPSSGFVGTSFQVTFLMTLEGTLEGRATFDANLDATSVIQDKKADCNSSAGCSPDSVLSVTVNVLTSAPIVTVSQFLSANTAPCPDVSFNGTCLGPTLDDVHGVADFSHTATLDVVLPDGFTFTSASGVFLSDAGPAPTVPEPLVLALFATALLGLGFLPRSRRFAS